MKAKDFVLVTLAVFIGSLAARVTVAAWHRSPHIVVLVLIGLGVVSGLWYYVKVNRLHSVSAPKSVPKGWN